MAMFKVLVPYNFTASDQKALDFVCSLLLERRDSVVTLFHLHQPVPGIPIGKDTVMERMRANINYLNQRIQEQEAELRKACLGLIAKGFAETRVSAVFEPKRKDVAADIVDKAHSGNFQMVVLNRKPGRAARFFTAPVHTKVVAGVADKTVCIVT